VHQKPQKVRIIFCGQKKIHQLPNIHQVEHTIQSRVHEECSTSRCKFQLKVETQAKQHMSNIQAFYLKVSQKTIISGLSPFGFQFAN
jgi:hypothetical protein